MIYYTENERVCQEIFSGIPVITFSYIFHPMSKISLDICARFQYNTHYERISEETMDTRGA